MQFQRLVKQSQIAYFAFDQLEIIRLGDPQTSPVVDTSTSTSASTTASIETTRTTSSTTAEPTSTPKTLATESTLIPTSTSTTSTLLTSSSTGDIRNSLNSCLYDWNWNLILIKYLKRYQH